MKRVQIYLILISIFTVLGSVFFARTLKAAPVTLNFNPTADSYVGADAPTAINGSQTQVRADGSPIVRAFLKFNLQGITGSVTKATLRIYGNSSHGTGFSVRGADNTWEELTINYNSQPTFSTTVTGNSGPISTGSWVEVNVTPLVTGNGLVSFALTTTSSTAMSLGSRESAQKPILIVEYENSGITPTVSPTPLNTPTPTISPVVSPTPIPSLTPTPIPSPTPPTGGEVVIAATGDMVCGAGSGGASCKQMEVSSLILGMNAQAFLTLGDVQYESGGYNDFLNFYHPSYGRLNSIVKPSVGNHEYNDPSTSDPTKIGYWDYFNGVGNFSGVAGDRNKGYYSYDLGDWHLIALNTNCSKVGGCGAGSPQETWLRADLAASTKSCTLAYYHHPLYSSGGRATTGSSAMWKALMDYKADVILTGHDHSYERFAYMDNNGNLNPNGIREFVVGTGGRNHTPFVSSAPNTEVFDSTSFGALKMNLRSGSYTWQFVPIPTNTFTDSGSNNCHPKGVVLPTPTPIPSLTPTPIPTSTPTPILTPTPTLIPTPTPTQQILTFGASDDASVYSGTPNNNYGLLQSLETDGSPVKRFYMKYTVSGIGTGTIINAKLRLFNIDPSNVGGSFYSAANTWVEGGVTWNTAPLLLTNISTLGSVASGSWYEVNVTPQVNGDGTYSFGISSTSTNGADYSSKNSITVSQRPQLVVTVQN